MNDPISDMLARIRNANLALLPTVAMPHSRMKESIAGILKREGYIFDFAVEGKLPKTIKLKLKYVGKKSVIEGLKRISTSEGLMTDTQARKKNVGGELLCFVW